jgi:hypothetical protein
MKIGTLVQARSNQISKVSREGEWGRVVGGPVFRRLRNTNIWVRFADGALKLWPLEWLRVIWEPSCEEAGDDPGFDWEDARAFSKNLNFDSVYGAPNAYDYAATERRLRAIACPAFRGDP